MIPEDEQNNKLQASVRMKLVNKFKHQLEEGSAVTLQCYSLGEIQPKFRIVNNRMRLSFLSNTVVEKCTDFKGSVHGFDFRPFNTITGLRVEEDGQFGMNIGKARKKKATYTHDVEGNELRCTLWGVFAEQFCDFLNACNDHGKIILVLQTGQDKFWDALLDVEQGMASIIVGTIIAIHEEEGW
ncbi:replication protein A 70 kDa DNA-binding subunit B, partial [Tanacetum coccineum]